MSNSTIGTVRFAYPKVFKPFANRLKNDELEYEVTILIPKEATEQCPDPKKVGAALTAVIKSAWAEKFGEKKGWRNPLMDGDTELNGDDEPKFPGYWFARASCKGEYPPVVVDGTRTPVTSGWGGGDWGNVLVNAWAYDKGANKGVSLGLRGVQFLYKGESFGDGGSASANDFPVVDNADTSRPKDDAPFDPFEDEE